MTSDRGPDFLKKHIGHDLKYLAFAAAEFSLARAERYQTSLQDSALVRGRTLIDCFARTSTDSLHIKEFFEDPDSAYPQSPQHTHDWFSFISERLAHVGAGREPEDGEDRWPDRVAGQEKGNDRLERLARLVIDLIRSRIPSVRDDCRVVLTTMTDRAEDYLREPTEERFHAMDPSNL